MKEGHITVLIVDDEAKSREVLEYHLRTIPGVEIGGVVSSAAEAYRMILEHVPEIIFLDVEMPGKTGFDLVNDLFKLDIHPCIIFQTAFEKYAIEAIKNAAFDYLLKPVDRESLLNVLARYRSSKNIHLTAGQVDQLLNFPNRQSKIKLKSKKGFILVDPDDIYYCQSDWNYTDIYHGENQKTTICLTLRKTMELLPDRSFFRISRSVVINLKYLTEVSRQERKCILRIGGKTEVFPINRERMGELEERVG